VSGDLGFPSGENRAACHSIRLDIRVIARESREPYGRALSCTPRLLRDFIFELITLDYYDDVTRHAGVSMGWLLCART
jgi:hypothetical protein